MERSEVLEFVRRNPTSFMATVENGEPRVRAMDTPVVDERGLTFCTGSVKDVCRQLSENPEVELCYWNREEGLQVRIRGRMKILDDLALKEQIVETRFTFLKPVVEQFGWEALTLFRLSSGEVRTWSPTNPAESASQVYIF
jgi:pyridoxamine 5'-phosphate oxidase